jgi:hypothetical protein
MFESYSHRSTQALEAAPSLDRLRELAQRRDLSAQDYEVSILRSQVRAVPSPDRVGSEVYIGQTRLGSDGGWKGLSEMVRSSDGVPVPVPVLKTLDPDTLEALFNDRLTQVDKQVRIWQPEVGERIIRGIVSPGYKRISATEQVEQLLNRLHGSAIQRHKLVKFSETPDSWSAEVVDRDVTVGFQDPELSDSLPGFKFRGNDVGGGSCQVLSYLWRLVCENGLVANLASSRMRAIHRGSGDWTGALHTGADWHELLVAAKAETFTDVEVFERLKALANRPNVKAIRQSLDEALKLTSPGQPLNRWTLSQGAAAAANNAESEQARQELQAWAGKVMTLPVSKSLPTLEANLLTA